jgi:hypothetical protein
MVGDHGAPSASEHPIAPDDEADEPSPRVEVPRGEQLRPREDRVADLAEEVLARHGDGAPQIARGPVHDREPSQQGIRDRVDGHTPPNEQPVERRVHTGMGGLLAKEDITLGTQRLIGDAGQKAAGVSDEEALHHRRHRRERLEKRRGPDAGRMPGARHLVLEALEVETGPPRRDRDAEAPGGI